MSRIPSARGGPETIRVDNDPEFISKALDRWAYENSVTLDFSRLGKPPDNAFVESFNGRRTTMPERPLVPVAGGCTGQNRGLAQGL